MMKKCALMVIVGILLLFCCAVSAEENSVLHSALRSAQTLVAETTQQVASIKMPRTMTWQQGGWTDGVYFWQLFINKDSASNEANNAVLLMKYNLETKEIEQQSSFMKLNHANDMTYNAKLGYFVVCHNSPNRNLISYIDPQTLEIVETVALPGEREIYCIDYNAATDRYVVGNSGGQSFTILDGDLNPISETHAPTDRTAECVTQGVATDDEFIYFVLYKPNEIAVYDWEGNFVTLIELDVGYIEPENISVVGDVIYVGCATKLNMKVFTVSDLKEKVDQ